MTTERWRDVGDGKIQDEVSGRIVPLITIRPPNVGRIVTLTNDEWAKLEKLAESQSTPKRTVTPEECVKRFIRSAQPGGSGWRCPSEGWKVGDPKTGDKTETESR